VLEAVAQESLCSTIVDSSHYPRRAQALRRILGPDRVRLVYLRRRPGAVARSFRNSGDKSWLSFTLYLVNVWVLAWWTMLTHPRNQRVSITYEDLLADPQEAAESALGRSVGPVDPNHLRVGPVFAGNRFLKTNSEIGINSNR
jgi:hypothetical protein